MNRKNQDLSFRPMTENRFQFSCHKGIECFTRCCRDLNLVLTPYDIIRLKARLKITSDTFLEDYTETQLDERNRFPLVYLKMMAERDKACPFVSPDGCMIYEDRPGACRIYPIGRAAIRPDSKRDTTERFFIVKEEHCLGFNEDKEWILEEWLRSEGVDDYNAMNDQWLDILTSQKSLGHPDHIPQKMQMFSMASYNLNQFRNFIFKSRFFDLFDVSADLREEMAEDDMTLMRFAFDWLQFSLFGEKKLDLKK